MSVNRVGLPLRGSVCIWCAEYLADLRAGRRGLRCGDVRSQALHGAGVYPFELPTRDAKTLGADADRQHSEVAQPERATFPGRQAVERIAQPQRVGLALELSLNTSRHWVLVIVASNRVGQLVEWHGGRPWRSRFAASGADRVQGAMVGSLLEPEVNLAAGAWQRAGAKVADRLGEGLASNVLGVFERQTMPKPLVHPYRQLARSSEGLERCRGASCAGGRGRPTDLSSRFGGGMCCAGGVGCGGGGHKFA